MSQYFVPHVHKQGRRLYVYYRCVCALVLSVLSVLCVCVDILSVLCIAIKVVAPFEGALYTIVAPVEGALYTIVAIDSAGI